MKDRNAAATAAQNTRRMMTEDSGPVGRGCCRSRRRHDSTHGAVYTIAMLGFQVDAVRHDCLCAARDYARSLSTIVNIYRIDGDHLTWVETITPESI
jgi:hypothetical protein